mgnify:CR=1 FL=1
MSKTHWLAIVQVLLTSAQALGFVTGEVSQALQLLVGAALTGTLVHRGVKIANGTAQ